MRFQRFMWRAAAGVVAGACAALALGVAPARAADDPPPHVVQDPHYGDGLFYFYQDRYFTALTTLMVSQHFNRLPHHADEAEVLRGGMLLSYGLHREAAAIFAQLIERGAAPPVRDRAWYFLAKIRYERGLVAEAKSALDRVEHPLPSTLEDDRQLLSANIAMALGDYKSAVTTLATIKGDGDTARIARYNLGVALIRAGDSAQGTSVLNLLGQTAAFGEEQRTLRDKANLALGFSALKDEKPAEARGYLERVRLTSPVANKALLGFGWADAALKLPKQALVPWGELLKRDNSDAAVLEARIAAPYALAEAGARAQALKGYEDAIAEFDRGAHALDESMRRIRSGAWVQSLLERNPGDEMGWFWTMRDLPELPHASHLTDVLAQHDFQEAFKNYRDLRFLSRNLQEWKGKLDVFDAMLANRRKGYADKLPQVQADAQTKDFGVNALSAKRDALVQVLDRAEADSDAAALADRHELALLERLERVQKALQQAGDDPDVGNARERARLAGGVLTWQLAQAFPERVWTARKGLQRVDAELAQARQRETELAQAQRDEPARFDAFAARIPVLAQRIDSLLPRVAALTQEQQVALQDIAVAALQRQKDRLAVYTTQARFAVAQLYDHANQAGSADHASQP